MNRVVDLLLTEDAPEADADTSEAGEEGQVVGGAVASQSVGALTVAIFADHGVAVVDSAVEEVEDVSAENRGQGHHTPVLGKTADAESLCNQRWEDAEQEAVRDAREAGDDNQRVRVGNGGSAELSKSEDQGGDEETPSAGHVELLDQDIRANALP